MSEPATERGFRVYASLTDRYGSKVRVQESSLATERCVWIFCNPDKPGNGILSPHLTVSQARSIRDALTRFIDE